jgi:hypothetical protein
LAARFLREISTKGTHHFPLIILYRSGAHGSSLRHASALSDQIVGLEVIHPDGSVHTVKDSPVLNHYRVAMGSLGVITTVTFSVVPLFKVQWSTSQHSEDVLIDGGFYVCRFVILADIWT